MTCLLGLERISFWGMQGWGYPEERVPEKYYCSQEFEVFKFLDPGSISITLTSSDSNRLGVVQNNRPRRITPRECARLQGFPDTFMVNPTDAFAYKQFSNSVSVPVVEAVMDDFLRQNKDSLGWR